MMSPEEIIGEVSTITGIPAPAITGRRRTVRVTRARFLSIAAIQSAHKDWSLEAVGALFNRGYSTMSKAQIRHCQLLRADRNYQSLAKQVCRSIFYGPATLR